MRMGTECRTKPAIMEANFHRNISRLLFISAASVNMAASRRSATITMKDRENNAIKLLNSTQNILNKLTNPKDPDLMEHSYREMLVQVSLSFPAEIFMEGIATGAEKTLMNKLALHPDREHAVTVLSGCFEPFITNTLYQQSFNMLGLGLPVVTRPFKSLDQILYFQKAMGDYEIGISVLTSMYTGKPFLILSRGDDKYNRARFMGLSTSIGHTHGLKYETASSQDFSFAALNYEYSGNIFALSFSGSGKKMLSYFNRDSYLFRNTEDEGLINNLLNRYGVISDHDGLSIPPTAAKPSGQRQKGSAV